MKRRTIKPEFFSDPKTGRLSPQSQILFVGLWCLADKEGYIENDLDYIRSQVFPYGQFKIDKSIDELLASGLVITCNYMQRQLLHVLNFKKHQPIHPHEAQSLIPPIESTDVIKCNYILLHPKGKGIGIDNNKVKDNYTTDFEIFWTNYPNKKARPDAEKAFAKARASGVGLQAILDGLESYKGATHFEGYSWAHPATWLNRRGWEDDYQSKSEKPQWLKEMEARNE